MPDVEIGGAVLEVPDEATPEQIKGIVSKFRTTPEFDKLIDKRTGAPAWVRSVVGGAPADDRLANIKRVYPDAQPYGDDNFVFTNPQTGRPTLYNEQSTFPSVGDIASLGREAAMTVGGTLGAVAGTLGLPGVGTVAGAGLGTAAGGQIADLTHEFLLGGIRTESTLERTVNAAIDFGSGAIGQRLGEVAPAAAKRALGGLSAKAQALVQSFRAFGIDAPAGAVSGSRTLATAERMLENTPGGGDVLQKQAETVLEQTSAAAKKLVARVGTPRTPEGASVAIEDAARAASLRFTERQAAAYERAFDLIGADTPVLGSNVTALREAMQQELAAAPRSLGSALRPAIRILQGIEDDAADGLAFSALREVRSAIGRDLAQPVLVGGTGARNEALKRVYGALTLDMSDAAARAGPEAAAAIKSADAMTRRFMTESADLLKKIDNFGGDDRAFRFVMQSARDGGRTLARMRGQFTAEEWDTVAASVLGRMGKPLPGVAHEAEFSIATFLTNWNKMAPEARKVLFSGRRYQGLGRELDRLVDVMGSLKGMQAVANTSNTARSMIYFSTLQTLVGALAGGAAGGPGGSVGGAAAAIVAPRVAARLITSPRFVSWLTTPVTAPSALGPHIARLASIAKASDPDLRLAIEDYAKALASQDDVQ